MYAKHGSLDKMLSVQEQVSWNAPIVEYAKNGKIEEVLNHFYQMKDPWLAIVLHKTGWEELSLLYFVFCIWYAF